MNRMQDPLRISLEREAQRPAELSRPNPSTLAAFVEAMPSATFLVDGSGRIRIANRAAARLFGYDVAAIEGVSVNNVLPEAAFVDRRGVPVLAMDGASRAFPNIRGLSRDGRDVYVDVGVGPVDTTEGPLALVAFCDVTRRAHAEQEIMRLASDLRSRLEELGEAVRAKDLLLREVHHRVKNNLQIVSSLLSLQARRVEDDVSRRLFEDSSDRLVSMSLVHEQLYRGSDLGRVDFAAYLRNLVAGISRGQVDEAHATISVQTDPVSLGIDVAVPVGMIVHELVTNALKHAFSNGTKGTIRVRLGSIGEGRYELAVMDDGGGFDPSVNKRASFGRRLVNLLVRQLEAEMETTVEEGTRVSIRFAEPGSHEELS